MIVIPGFIISILTFPGVIIHEAAHLLFCRLRKVPVLEVRYFQFHVETSGYVVYEKTDSFLSIFLISMGPFFVNTVLCLLICFPAALPFYYFEDRSILTFFLLWLGVSIGMHAIPSTVDVKAIWDKAKEEVSKKNIFAFLCFPLVLIMYIANFLKMIWFDALYGIFIGIILPALVLGVI